MDTIIALQSDHHNSGKTSVLTILRNEFLADRTYVQVPGRHHTCDHDSNDFVDIFMKHNMLIGISSAGDSYDLIIKYLNELSLGDDRCNIIFTACGTTRYTWGRSTIAAVQSFAQYVQLYSLKEIAPHPIPYEERLVTPFNVDTAHILFQISEQLVR